MNRMPWRLPQKTPEDAAKLIDIISQSIYEKDGVYYFDGEKAVELGLDQEQAQIIQKLWDSSTEFLTVISQCIEKTDGEYTFNKEKAVELGFTEKEALSLISCSPLFPKVFISFNLR